MPCDAGSDLGLTSNYGRLIQRTLRGGVRPHPMVSVTPEAISAQALSVALRSANSSVLPAAVRHEDRP